MARNLCRITSGMSGHGLFICILLIHTDLVTPGSGFWNLTVNSRMYFLSEEVKDIPGSWTACSSHLSSTLAEFDNYSDFQQTVNILTDYFKTKNLESNKVWIAVRFTPINSNNFFSWKTEPIISNVWVSDNADDDCAWNHFSPQCCVAMTWSNDNTGTGLSYKPCTRKYHYLCILQLVNECLGEKRQCSQICEDNVVGFECSCVDGYSLDSDKSTCLDVDECAVNICSRNCSDTLGVSAYTCTNTIGNFTCSCKEGFKKSVNGLCCEDVDECTPSLNTCEHSCNNTNGSFHCTCLHGYVLEADDKHCRDVDECEVHRGRCQHTCINSPASYQCDCLPGFVLNSDNKTCNDIDECTTDPLRCTQVCINNKGAYTCSCDRGYVLHEDNYTCVDVDECSEYPNPCTHLCDNVNGSYICSCREGFKLLPDKTTCLDIDECHVDHTACHHMWVTAACQFTCTFVPGNSFDVGTRQCSSRHNGTANLPVCYSPCENKPGGYACRCPSGFDSNGSICIDLNECAESDQKCSHECTNLPGSYICSCPPGLRIADTNQSQCIDIDECHENVTDCQQDCINTEGSYKCACFHGYEINSTDESSCQDVDECSEGNNPCQQVCFNSPGSFSCLCYPGFELGPDKVSCTEVQAIYKCPCRCSKSSHYHSNNFSTLKEETNRLRRHLKINYGSLSTTERRKNSAGDRRTSSQIAGFLFFICVAIPFALIIVIDISRLVYQGVLTFQVAIAGIRNMQR